MDEEDCKNEGKTNDNSFIKYIPNLQEAICKFDDGHNKGTGFYLRIPYKEKYITALLTCNHVLKIEKNISTIYYYNSNNQKKDLDLKVRRYWPRESNNLDYTCIEILEKDGVKNFLDIDKNILNENYSLKKGKTIQIYNYDLKQSVGNIRIKVDMNGKEKNYIYYNCNTDKGWSGGPVLTSNCLLIGVHKGSGINENKGINIKYIVNDIIKQIEEDNNKKEP